MSKKPGLSLPPELLTFVSSAEEIFRELRGCDGSESGGDVCSYAVQFDYKVDTDSSAGLVEQVLKDFADVKQSVAERVKGYQWYRDPFRLSLVLPESNGEGEGRDRAYLCGHSRYGDCVDDAWFIVWLLLELSKEMQHLSCAISDSDGEFLLIEAALHIPPWLTPDNSTNRVWIRRGSVHIVPIDEPGKTASGGIQLESALRCLRDHQGTGVGATCADEKVQVCIRARTVDLYPTFAVVSSHRCVVALPRPVAYVLQRLNDENRRLLSLVIGAFCSPDASTRGTNKEKRSHTASLDRLGMYLDDDVDIVAVEVCISRSLYARLVFQPFQPPLRMHKFLRRATSELEARQPKEDYAAAGSVRRQAAQSAELGCRIICGLEIVFQRGIFAYKPASHAHPDAKIVSELSKRGLCVDGLSLRDLCFASSLVSESAALRLQREETDTLAGFALDMERLLSCAECGGSNDVATAPMLTVDDDGWLRLSPEELEAEMIARVRQRQQGGTPASSPQPAGAATEGVGADSDSMQDIIEGMQRFMAQEAGLEGLRSAPLTAKTVSNIAPAALEDNLDDGIGGLDVDLNRLEAVLRALPDSTSVVDEEQAEDWDDDEDEDEEDVEDEDEEEEDDEARSEGAVGKREANKNTQSGSPGCSNFSLPARGASVASREEDDGSSEDSDDEMAFDDFDYEAMMENELLDSTLAASFVRTEDGREVDVEQNLLTHLLESHASQLGGAGPASTLLSQMGISLPKPPTSKSI